jgi:hypothetical protein
MEATDQNGLKFSVFQCGRDCVRDMYWNVYLLRERTAETETYVGSGVLVAHPDGGWASSDVITVERCDCEGTKDPAPGAQIYDGDDVQGCLECQRFVSDEDACSAYAAGLNRAVGHEHFVAVFGNRQRIATRTDPTKTLNEQEITSELDHIGAAPIESMPSVGGTPKPLKKRRTL